MTMHSLSNAAILADRGAAHAASPGPASPLTMLDCTFRDGGYYNAWSFSRALANRYLAAMAAAHVDVVEIGFRFLSGDSFRGPFAYSTDEFLDTLDVPLGLTLAVMVNAKDFITQPDVKAAVAHAFRPAAKSQVQLVRIAAHLHEIEQCQPIACELKRLGYAVGYNLMQSTNKPGEVLSRAAERVASWDAVDILYFADSFGNLTPARIPEIVRSLREGWDGPIGIHAHDNRGMALHNTLAAVDAGASWIDATVMGMGRGAGNVRTEYLLLELRSRGHDLYRPDDVFPLAMTDFHEMHRKYGWGHSLMYYLSAMYDIHPTYVQEMMAAERFEPHEMLMAVERLKRSSASSFTAGRLQEATRKLQFTDRAGAWNASGWLAGKTVLLLGRGPSLVEHRDAVERYIERHKPVVICLNVRPDIPAEWITAYAACHPFRVEMESKAYRGLNRPLIIPHEAFSGLPRGTFDKVEILDYGMEVEAGVFEAGPNGCVVPCAMASGYCLALCVAAGAERVLLAGFDGYEKSDPRQADMIDMFEAYERAPNKLPLAAITPTTYPVAQHSIYAPDLWRDAAAAS